MNAETMLALTEIHHPWVALVLFVAFVGFWSARFWLALAANLSPRAVAMVALVVVALLLLAGWRLFRALDLPGWLVLCV